MPADSLYQMGLATGIYDVFLYNPILNNDTQLLIADYAFDRQSVTHLKDEQPFFSGKTYQRLFLFVAGTLIISLSIIAFRLIGNKKK